MVTIGQRNIIREYSTSGIIKGGELLLSRESTLPFIEALEESGVQINGCDLWRYLNSTRNTTEIVALLGDGILVHDAEPLANTIEEYAKIVKEYVKYKLPKDTDFISLIFEDIEIYDFLREIGDVYS